MSKMVLSSSQFGFGTQRYAASTNKKSYKSSVAKKLRNGCIFTSLSGYFYRFLAATAELSIIFRASGSSWILDGCVP